VADSAQVIGQVTLAEDSSVWFGVVIRGDTSTITVGKGSNIQDNSVIGLSITKEMSILTPAGIVRGCRSDEAYIRVCIPTPMDHQADLAITVEGRTFVGDYVNVGIPHFVVPVDDLASLDVVRYGRALRHHDHFKPRGANINFIRIVKPGVIENRTYEFGVEDETMACGTGSSASAVMTALHNGWEGPIRSGDTPVRVMTRSGDELRVYFEADDQGTIHDVCLESIVRPLYHGTISEEFLS
jgi:diaminopimelate epimerase